ncbi:methylmalonyl-CoA mutase family protein [Chryseosolibacter indicus]|uniref:Methylmalonyl-CoA mutase alpha/beta chain catalytic domain-containing protein n=1 Tax=Chryseosolibacter indicus TaxID=2782351 RepID=A0ABS5VR07_9BACT|nr:methylmalonyl-CoA mutase family protein [Chryseosolibacter indicus]MBT1703887.1 hypothetical protein [Chryseosolibacter indicus]
MKETDIQKLLSDTFSVSDVNEWKRVATSELDGKEPFQELKWKDPDNIEYLPYYDKTTTQHTEVSEFHRSPLNKDFLGNRTWFNTPVIHVVSLIAANQKALQHLKNGADGIVFDFNSLSSIDLEILLKDIELPYCAISFINATADVSNAFINHVVKHNIDQKSIKGSFFWKNIDDAISSGSLRNFNYLGCIVNSSTPVNEISEALLAGVKQLEKSQGDERVKAFSRISFSLPIHTNFLIEISKLKALRMLWFQIANVYKVNSYNFNDLHIHARVEAWSNEKLSPHENMLRGTTSAMASIIGGCDSLSVYPQDENNSMMDRIARNVSNILREESHFDKVEDPLAGAYVIESMVNQLAEKAWDLFKTKQK